MKNRPLITTAAELLSLFIDGYRFLEPRVTIDDETAIGKFDR